MLYLKDTPETYKESGSGCEDVQLMWVVEPNHQCQEAYHDGESNIYPKTINFIAGLLIRGKDDRTDQNKTTMAFVETYPTS